MLLGIRIWRGGFPKRTYLIWEEEVVDDHDRRYHASE